MSVADSGSELIPSLSPAIRIAELIPKRSLSSFAWSALAHVWCSIVDRHQLDEHPHRKKFFEAQKLYRQFHQLPPSRLTKDKSDRERLKSIMVKSKEIVEYFDKKGIAVDHEFVDLAVSDLRQQLYISLLAKETASCISVLVAAVLDKYGPDVTFEKFDEAARHSANALSYACCLSMAEHEFLKSIDRQSYELRDQYAGKMGVYVSKVAVEQMERQARALSVASPPIMLVRASRSSQSFNLGRMGVPWLCTIALASCLLTTGLGIVFASKVTSAVAIATIGAVVLSASQIYVWNHAKTSIEKAVFNCCSVLFFLEATYLAFCGLGIITLR